MIFSFSGVSAMGKAKSEERGEGRLSSCFRGCQGLKGADRVTKEWILMASKLTTLRRA